MIVKFWKIGHRQMSNDQLKENVNLKPVGRGVLGVSSVTHPAEHLEGQALEHPQHHRNKGQHRGLHIWTQETVNP